MNDDLIPGTVARLRYPLDRRCNTRINPKRPTWRCKNTATWIWIADEKEPDGKSRAALICDEHLKTFGERP